MIYFTWVQVAAFVFSLILLIVVCVIACSCIWKNDDYQDVKDRFLERERQKRWEYGEYMYKRGYDAAKNELQKENKDNA